MNSQGNQVKTYTKEGSINAQFVLDSIDDWVNSLSKLTVLVLDNAKIHHAKIFQEAITRWHEKGLYIFFLPPYSPHLNKIETLWRECKYRWIKPQDYQSLETLKLALDKIWESFGTEYQINFK
jgi:transposase